jgi:hypothetical protein
LIRKSASAFPFLAAMLIVSACADDNGAKLDALRRVPLPDLGEVYFESSSDGSCRLDCPNPGSSRGVLVDCDELSAVEAAYAEQLEAIGLRLDDDRYIGSVEGVTVEVVITAYTDASQGSNPNVDPFDEPADVASRCSIVGRASAP